ncbi:hypothetical protein ACFL1E_01745 [Candidatus Omnitrophota bacterium]
MFRLAKMTGLYVIIVFVLSFVFNCLVIGIECVDEWFETNGIHVPAEVIEIKDKKELKGKSEHLCPNCTRYVEIESLKLGDAISVFNNKKLTQSKITRIMENTSSVTVHNLEVDGAHHKTAPQDTAKKQLC